MKFTANPPTPLHTPWLSRRSLHASWCAAVLSSASAFSCAGGDATSFHGEASGDNPWGDSSPILSALEVDDDGTSWPETSLSSRQNEGDLSDFGTLRQPIIDADGTGNPGGHAVAVSRSGSSIVCSGTLLRNDVVLTADHCVAPSETITVRAFDANGRLTGPSVTSTEVREVRRCRNEPDLCPPDRDDDGVIDVAVVKLASPLSLDGDTKNGFRSFAFNSDSQLAGQPMICSGRGATTCGGGASSRNRFGRFVIDRIATTRTHFDPASSAGDPFMTGGDSGAGCYHDIPQSLQKPKLITNFTNADKTPPCEGNNRGEVPSVIRPWVRAQLSDWADDVALEFSSASDLNRLTFFTPEGSSEPNWRVRSGALEQTTNAGGGDLAGDGPHALLDGLVMANGCIETKIVSSDDDSAGLLMGYESPERHYRLRVSEPNVVRLESVRNDSVRTVGSSNASIDWSSGVTLKLCREERLLRVFVNGTERIVSNQVGFTDGQVGVYNRFLQGARYEYFRATNDSTVYPEH